MNRILIKISYLLLYLWLLYVWEKEREEIGGGGEYTMNTFEGQSVIIQGKLALPLSHLGMAGRCTLLLYKKNSIHFCSLFPAVFWRGRQNFLSASSLLSSLCLFTSFSFPTLFSYLLLNKTFNMSHIYRSLFLICPKSITYCNAGLGTYHTQSQPIPLYSSHREPTIFENLFFLSRLNLFLYLSAWFTTKQYLYIHYLFSM